MEQQKQQPAPRKAQPQRKTYTKPQAVEIGQMTELTQLQAIGPSTLPAFK